MADNYLEKHYDDYLKRKAEWEKKKKKSGRHAATETFSSTKNNEKK